MISQRGLMKEMASKASGGSSIQFGSLILSQSVSFNFSVNIKQNIKQTKTRHKFQILKVETKEIDDEETENGNDNGDRNRSVLQTKRAKNTYNITNIQKGKEQMTKQSIMEQAKQSISI